MLLAVRWVWRLRRGVARPGWPLAWPLAAFAFATLLAAALSARPAESFFAARKMMLLASLWIVRDAVPDTRTGRATLLGLLAVTAIASVVGIAQVAYCADWPRWIARLGEAGPWLGPLMPWLTKLGTKCHRARAFYSIYMTFGGILSIVLLAVLPELVWSRGRPRWAPFAWLLAFVALALTYVRGAWLGFAAGVVILGGSLRRGRAVLLGGLVALAIVLLLLPGVRMRARSIGDPNDPTASERMLMWRSGIAIARDHLLTGVGPGQVKHVYPRYASPDAINQYRSHVHNAPLQVLVERGVLGLGAWLALFGAFFLEARRIQRRVPEDSHERALVVGGVAATAGFLLAGLFEHNFGDSEVLLVATFVMGLVLSYSRSSDTAT